MAYKDEYEVARLLLDDAAAEGYVAVGGPDTTVTYLLHPPMLRSLGLDRKLKLQRSAVPALRHCAPADASAARWRIRSDGRRCDESSGP